MQLVRRLVHPAGHLRTQQHVSEATLRFGGVPGLRPGDTIVQPLAGHRRLQRCEACAKGRLPRPVDRLMRRMAYWLFSLTQG